MRNYGLGFISDVDLYMHTKDTVKKYRFKINLRDFNKNLVDPIKLTFDSKVYGKGISDIVEREVARQLDKSNTNHIGYFHQNIFNYIGSGWSVPDKGYDVVHKSDKYFVEMKNKHNTMNSSSSQKTYMRMQNTLINEPTAICMLVEVIAKNSQNASWSVSLDGVPMSHPSIRRVSMDKFYELVTGDRVAFKSLCEVLPLVIEDIVNEEGLGEKVNTVVDELKNLSPNLLKSLYMLSFGKYEGFGDFNV